MLTKPSNHPAVSMPQRSRQLVGSKTKLHNLALLQPAACRKHRLD